MSEEYDREKMVTLLLALLDRIEIEEDHTLASQRHSIAEDCGLTVEFREQTSGRLQ